MASGNCSYSAKGREDEALAEYLEFGFIDAKEYLKMNYKNGISHRDLLRKVMKTKSFSS